ncbi:MAG: hypothetical protein A2600_01505 [Candidatus Lambdaproteobacteria bacterium RIFOXYD1_FULL_56_27]|uniref:Uncharacterized protein n=1 Tax=Candidatus Lambdaproteobacteria bacterium RIFOXYD2_FULL_56_26 TaxID=1817773 RepID=A0A1F6GR71_9PROT|nr:MAG: hypothetical protein A2557_10360 [Candidatus Lambdaproteobacteria bacterium RIFOXYD2_FULL_56_26]OGH05439.1 MAG: hypothetical protein A2426_02915 [Candidatus Lambdaproteobacteria bacterium RIFOXYC1_FULL_56_13]OGH06951.1 MAG: hypothetical protein A2600_01505 [Candidatus Lambdaproteobacteria bacterium RIFOXYD1_FULL_56_27]
MEPITLQLLTFANQLSKLLKVINHSDPSAASMKKPLYEKYKQALADFHDEVAELITWPELQRLLNGLPESPGYALDEVSGPVVLAKLKKDLQEKFVVPHQLTEFDSPQTRGTRPKPKAKPATPPKPPIVDPELLVQMAQMDERQQKATQSLQGMINAINKLGPGFLEKKILSAVPKDLDRH